MPDTIHPGHVCRPPNLRPSVRTPVPLGLFFGDIVRRLMIGRPVRRHLSSELILMPLLLAGLSACMSIAPVPNEDVAIAIFKEKCPRSSRSDFGPYIRWDAQLVRGNWHVHARSQMTYQGKAPRWVDTYLDVPKDGSPLMGSCLEQVTE